MTFTRKHGDERTDEAGWPWSHCKTFLERLAVQGYAAVTIQEYRTVSGRFGDIIEKRGFQIGESDGAAMARLRHAVLSGVTYRLIRFNRLATAARAARSLSLRSSNSSSAIASHSRSI
jgi:hypothetical protein